MMPVLQLLLPLLPLAEMTQRLWYALPLLVASSLVYVATRYEEPLPILVHAVRFGLGLTLFIGLVAAVVQLTTWTL